MTKVIDIVKLTHYKCHKQVHASPLNRRDYNLYKGWKLPVGENGDDEGYVVFYNKGTSDEHVSWSPKKIFEGGYSDMASETLDASEALCSYLRYELSGGKQEFRLTLQPDLSMYIHPFGIDGGTEDFRIEAPFKLIHLGASSGIPS